MQKITTFAVALSLFWSCGNKAANSEQTEQSNDQETPSSHAPVETQSPNTDYKPAFKGQTRIAGVVTSSPYKVSELTDDLDRPWGIVSMPDGRLLITEKSGTMRIATTSGKLSDKISGLPKVDDAGQGGLLGLTIDPDFKNNRMVYWVFSERVADGNHTAVAKGRLSSDEKMIESATVIYRATPSYDGDKHYGGRILFDKSGHLFVSTGERSDLPTRPQSQSLKSGLGKLIRITTDGKPAPGNPNISEARPEIFSYGHRNPQGIAFHPETGDLWLSEMGPRGGDEVNLIKAGKNYGWPTITYGIEYSGKTIGDGITQKEGMEQPVYYWDPVTSPSGMTFYSGNAIPEWKNNLFIGGLSSRHIVRLVIKDNKVTGEERLLVKEGNRYRDIAQGNDAALYVVTDEGKLFRVGK